MRKCQKQQKSNKTNFEGEIFRREREAIFRGGNFPWIRGISGGNFLGGIFPDTLFLSVPLKLANIKCGPAGINARYRVKPVDIHQRGIIEYDSVA